MRPPLVFAAPYVPVPARSGAPIRSHRLMMGLAHRFDVVLVAPDGPRGAPGARPGDEEIARELPGVDVIRVAGRPLRVGKRLNQAMTIMSSAPWETAYATPAVRGAVLETARARGARIVHFDDPGSACAGPIAGAVNVFAPHNIEHEIHRGAAAASPGLARRAFARLEARKLKRMEEAQWRWADLCVAVSDADAEVMRRGGARSIAVAPNGTDPIERRPHPRRAPGEPLRLLFVGSDYLPNREGLRWLVDDILPAVRARVPVVLDVVGMPVDATPAGPGVTAHGRVPSVDPYYSAAHAAVVPIPYGSGTRLKVVEAMARGVPVVSTRLGAAGLPVVAGQHFLAADEAPAFADALVAIAGRLADGDGRLEPMLAAARAVAEELFWPEIIDRLADVYEAALHGASHPGSSAA